MIGSYTDINIVDINMVRQASQTYQQCAHCREVIFMRIDFAFCISTILPLFHNEHCKSHSNP